MPDNSNILKDRFDFILAYSALIISLTAFKSELDQVVIDLTFMKFSLSEYLLAAISTFVGLIHLYAIPYFLGSTQIILLRVLNSFQQLLYFMFALVIFSPLIILGIIGANIVFSYIQKVYPNYHQLVPVTGIAGLFTGFLLGVVVGWRVSIFRKNRKLSEISAMSENEYQKLVQIDSLIKEGKFSESILEAYSLLDDNIYKLFILDLANFRRKPLDKMLEIVFKNKLFTEDIRKDINELRVLHSSILAFKGSSATKEEAEKAFDLINKLSGTIIEITNWLTRYYNKFFAGKVFSNLRRAGLAGKIQKKPIFTVVYNSLEVNRSKVDYALRYFTEYKETKQLLKKHFIQLILDTRVSRGMELLAKDADLSTCYIVLIGKDRNLLFRDPMPINPDAGLEKVKELIALSMKQDGK